MTKPVMLVVVILVGLLTGCSSTIPVKVDAIAADESISAISVPCCNGVDMWSARRGLPRWPSISVTA